MHSHRRILRLAAAALAVGAGAPQAPAAIDLYIDFFREQGSADFLNAGATTGTPYVFYARPWAGDESSITSLFLSSSTGALTATTTGSSGTFATFADTVDLVTTGLWTLKVNDDKTYAFGLSLGDLTEAMFPRVSITTPASGSTGVSQTPTIVWEAGNAGELFTSVSYEMIKDFNGGFGYPPPNPLALTDTSLVAPGSLEANTQYGFHIIYTRGAPEITLVGTPFEVDANGDQVLDTEGNPIALLDSLGNPMEFRINASLFDQGASAFTTIPEPATTAMLAGVAMLGFAALRRCRKP